MGLLELETARDLDGVPVNFSKLAPGGFIVVDINGRSSLLSKEQWKSLPKWQSSARQRQKSFRAPSYGAWLIAVLFAVMGVCCAIACVLAATGIVMRKISRLRRSLRAA